MHSYGGGAAPGRGARHNQFQHRGRRGRGMDAGVHRAGDADDPRAQVRDA